MANKDGSKSGGRRKGVPNKGTVLAREEAQAAAKKIAAAAGIKLEDIDAHTLLQLFYRCEDFTPRFRKECAAEALKYEKAALTAVDSRSTETIQYVVEMPPAILDLDEWKRLHGGQPSNNQTEWDNRVQRVLGDLQPKRDNKETE
jgi:hypothetical protein